MYKVTYHTKWRDETITISFEDKEILIAFLMNPSNHVVSIKYDEYGV